MRWYLAMQYLVAFVSGAATAVVFLAWWLHRRFLEFT